MQIVIEDGKTKRYTTETPDGIYGFFPPFHRFLSNFHLCNITMPDGLTYPSTENAFQAQKTLDLVARRAFTTCTPGVAKAMGGALKLRPDWDSERVNIMRICLQEKFKDAHLLELLKATGSKYLREDNNWGDKFWGYCNG